MKFHTDVQIHSKYSRATSKNADIEGLALWGLKKGITIVGTGDFTHPAWFAEIKEKLMPAEPGLFRLKPEVEKRVLEQTPQACRNNIVRFMMEVEISTIYKKWDKVRKVHHLIFTPDWNSADLLVEKLSKIGNLKSDGRPILGLDSRNLLEITLETSQYSYLIPAHIWTPWFAALGSKSGFDRIDDCYGDLAHHVFAVETGLSSDPAMNWQISSLDRFRLVSNSDAHSPPKIGREATTYNTDLNYFSILEALKSEDGKGFIGTIEFFPEEGKYHLDGHRKCNICFEPDKTKEYSGICPVCNKPLTVGVLNRISALADRTAEEALKNPPPKAGEILYLIPLPEILSEIYQVGIGSNKINYEYENLLHKLGSEIDILDNIPVEDIKQIGGDLLAEGITRLRNKQVIRYSGYDGEYGVIKLFEADELQKNKGAMLFDGLPVISKSKKDNIAKPQPQETDKIQNDEIDHKQNHAIIHLDEEQQRAVNITEGALMIIAGPGSGKTRTLTYRIASLVQCKTAPQNCLAITFTNRAANEMKQRLSKLLPEEYKQIPIHTFHSLGFEILKEYYSATGLKKDFNLIDETKKTEILMQYFNLSDTQSKKLAKNNDLADEQRVIYQKLLRQENLVDFDDLINLPIELLTNNPDILNKYRQKFQYISVDEFQDIDPGQYEMVKLLAPARKANICIIGDYNQAIYSFRGADPKIFKHFENDYNPKTIRLSRNYRSGSTIVEAAKQIIKDDSLQAASNDSTKLITIHQANSEAAEAEFVAHGIEQIIGGHSFFSIDSNRVTNEKEGNFSFADFAILYRTSKQADAISEALYRLNMPFKKYSNKLLINNVEVKDLLNLLKSRPDEFLPREALKKAATELNFTHDYLPGFLRIADESGSLEECLHKISLLTEMDMWHKDADYVSLMTIHGAKGLEFPVVFMVGLEDGILPLHFAGGETNPDEEKRLLYVGITRAEKQLFLSYAKKRMWNGKICELPPCPWLKQIEEGLLKKSDDKARKRKENKQPGLF